MGGNLYFYRRDHNKNCNGKCKPGCEHQDLPDAIREKIKHFVEKFGYYPEFVIVRLEEYNSKDKYPIRIVKTTKLCPPSHFMLCPVVKREPRHFVGTRKTYK